MSGKLYSYNTSIGNPKFNVLNARRRRFSPDFLRAQNMVRVIEGKIIENYLRGNENIGSS